MEKEEERDRDRDSQREREREREREKEKEKSICVMSEINEVIFELDKRWAIWIQRLISFYADITKKNTSIATITYLAKLNFVYYFRIQKYKSVIM